MNPPSLLRCSQSLWLLATGLLDGLRYAAALSARIVVNFVAVLSISDTAPAALQQHVIRGVLLAGLLLYGLGK